MHKAIQDIITVEGVLVFPAVPVWAYVTEAESFRREYPSDLVINKHRCSKELKQHD